MASMKTLDLKTLGTVTGGTICAPVCAPACPPPAPELRQHQVQEGLLSPRPRRGTKAASPPGPAPTTAFDDPRRNTMKKLDLKTLGTVAGGTLGISVGVGVSVGCAPACPPAPTCGSTKSKKGC
jgi:hypothetical protein